MCVIVHQAKNQHLDKDTARKLWKTNPDGGGFAFVDDDGELRVHKYMEFNEFWRNFERLRSLFPRRDYLLHMRIATHGEVELSNVHPFKVDEHTVMGHNGIIHGVTPWLDKDDKRSDTLYFVEEVLPRLPETWLDDPFLRDMVDEWVGWSKLMFITNNPKLSLTVYRLGKWDEHEGIAMSNTNGLKQPEPKVRSWDWSTNRPSLPKPSEKKKGKVLSIDDLRTKRAQRQLIHPILIIDPNPEDPIIMCDRCSGTIDLDTGLCVCWEEICMECLDFMALCENCTVMGLTYDELSPEQRNTFVQNALFTQGLEDLTS